MKNCTYDIEGQLYIAMEVRGDFVFFISYEDYEEPKEGPEEQKQENEKTVEEGDVFMKENLKFMDKTHKKVFEEVCNKMPQSDCYHISFAYLVSLDVVLRDHIDDVFDFEEDCIKRDGLQKDWQTGTSRKTLRLAFNLWNSCHYDNEIEDGSCGFYSVDEIFCNQEYFEYYWVAINIRFNYF